MFKILFIFLFSVFAEEVKFLPYMAEHENLGCPSNSQCSKKIGLIRHQWINIAKSNSPNKLKRMNNFINSYGALIPVWGRESSQANKELILWDSSCKNHNNEKLESMKLIEVYSKNINSLKDQKDIFIPNALRLNKKKPTTRKVIRGDAPVLIDGDDFLYIKESEGFYYGLRLKSNGEIRVEETPKVTNYPSEIKCSDEHTKALLSMSPVKNLYQGSYCKIIWNRKSKSYETLAFGWSCD
ncbi:hypothetical protein BMS_2161 [Halobacteriovorax marinus SJ]|uniref:Uncharacterized protein n=1 Tax=Halobacteriovorax marinus (strain ATCC BAA-682 / DSM 15412 / SJ) TaxID=862908 RepID=E1X3N8_HALMS|nr:hypothetical protein [Halobacteriovorax marinus]CBW26967.1 hypothetical protein BMS_2161 [Halobacteriovorax marinus SJ]